MSTLTKITGLSTVLLFLLPTITLGDSAGVQYSSAPPSVTGDAVSNSPLNDTKSGQTSKPASGSDSDKSPDDMDASVSSPYYADADAIDLHPVDSAEPKLDENNENSSDGSARPEALIKSPVITEDNNHGWLWIIGGVSGLFLIAGLFFFLRQHSSAETEKSYPE